MAPRVPQSWPASMPSSNDPAMEGRLVQLPHTIFDSLDGLQECDLTEAIVTSDRGCIISGGEEDVPRLCVPLSVVRIPIESPIDRLAFGGADTLHVETYHVLFSSSLPDVYVRVIHSRGGPSIFIDFIDSSLVPRIGRIIKVFNPSLLSVGHVGHGRNNPIDEEVVFHEDKNVPDEDHQGLRS